MPSHFEHEAVWGAQLRRELADVERLHPTWVALSAAARVVLASLQGEDDEEELPLLARQPWHEWRGPCSSPPRKCGCGPRGRHKRTCAQARCCHDQQTQSTP